MFGRQYRHPVFAFRTDPQARTGVEIVAANGNISEGPYDIAGTARIHSNLEPGLNIDPIVTGKLQLEHVDAIVSSTRAAGGVSSKPMGAAMGLLMAAFHNQEKLRISGRVN